MDEHPRGESWLRESWLGPGLAAIGLILAAGYLLAWLIMQMVVPDFADDHGVSRAPDWVRCSVETIERHPGPFGATSGFDLDWEMSRTLTVHTAWLTTKVEVVEGSLTYWRWRGHHFVSLDCPDASSQAGPDHRADTTEDTSNPSPHVPTTRT